jgi:hypothetical protein
MRAHTWLLGLVSVGTVAGMTAAGCGSSSSGPSDAGSDATEDAGPDVCNPQPVTLPDSGTCSACIMSMCSAQYAACNADCTCGPQVNSVAMCLANLPPPSDAGGLGALLGPGLQLLMCFGGGGAAGGGAAGGALGGGGALAGGAAPAATPTSDYVQCLFTSCMTDCTAVADGGPDGAPTSDTGAPETGSDTGAADTGATDSAVDSSSVDASDGGAVDSPFEGSTDAAPDVIIDQ